MKQLILLLAVQDYYKTEKKHQMDVNELIKISEICFTIFFWLVYSHTVLMRSRLYLGSWDSLGNLHKENYILIPWTL
jgi:hypothetical protein